MLSALLFATTIYAQIEQQTSDKVKRTNVVVIDGYLKVYPEDLGEFSEEPIALISQLNKECKYGYNSWRVPTQREINMIRSNGYASDQKYMTQSDYNGILLLVTTQETEIDVIKFNVDDSFKKIIILLFILSSLYLDQAVLINHFSKSKTCSSEALMLYLSSNSINLLIMIILLFY